MKRTRRTLKRQKRIPKILFLLVGVFLLVSLGSWVWGERTGDPFANTPLILKDGSIRFQNFRPQLEKLEEERYVTHFENGVTVVYTVDAALQKEVKSFFEKYRVPYGAFVAIEPKSGKILALVDHSTRDPQAEALFLRASYPAASIFKLVTAAAAIEKKQIAPDTTIPYRGKFNRLKPAYWKDNPKKDKLKTTLTDALANSNNVVFAKVAIRWLDIPTLLEYGTHFQFNRQIPFESPVEISPMEIAESESALAKTAAGFGAVGLSPLHAALLGSAIANNGIMMSPCMVEFVTDPQGEKIYECIPKILAKTISPKTAGILRDMMAQTVKNGTVQDVFRPQDLERSLRGISIGGKTGSLRGKTPPGRYTWFIGMAPLEDPEIVVAAMVVNDPVWRIIAPQVAKIGLATYFQSHKPKKKISGTQFTEE